MAVGRFHFPQNRRSSYQDLYRIRHAADHTSKQICWFIPIDKIKMISEWLIPPSDCLFRPKQSICSVADLHGKRAEDKRKKRERAAAQNVNERIPHNLCSSFRWSNVARSRFPCAISILYNRRCIPSIMNMKNVLCNKFIIIIFFSLNPNRKKMFFVTNNDVFFLEVLSASLSHTHIFNLSCLTYVLRATMLHCLYALSKDMNRIA